MHATTGWKPPGKKTHAAPDPLQIKIPPGKQDFQSMKISSCQTNPRNQTVANQHRKPDARPNKTAIKCRDPGSNRGPSDLRSDALPAELSRLPSATAARTTTAQQQSATATLLTKTASRSNQLSYGSTQQVRQDTAKKLPKANREPPTDTKRNADNNNCKPQSAALHETTAPWPNG